MRLFLISLKGIGMGSLMDNKSLVVGPLCISFSYFLSTTIEYSKTVPMFFVSFI